MKTILYSCLTLVLIISCNQQPVIVDKTKWTEEIKKAETEFMQRCKEKSIADAFEAFAAENAIIKRGNDSLITGKSGISHYYSAPHFKTARVQWAPDSIFVSDNGDMAWSYGRYAWVFRDSTGKEEQYKGVYQTIWQRQADGKWKYVWD
jgi:ketosteroid isomerase-like protein